MRWFAWMRLLALVVWLPATSHCRLASLPALSFLACAHQDDSESPHSDATDDGDGCASVESASYRSEDRVDLPEPWLSGGNDVDPGGACESGRGVPPPSEAIQVIGTSPPSEQASRAVLLRSVGMPRAPSCFV